MVEENITGLVDVMSKVPGEENVDEINITECLDCDTNGPAHVVIIFKPKAAIEGT